MPSTTITSDPMHADTRKRRHNMFLFDCDSARTRTIARCARWTAVALAALALAACGGKQERLSTHLQKGKDYYAKGEWDKARIEVKNVLQIEPKTAEGWYYAGLLEERQGNWNRAYADYLRTTELDPSNLSASVKLGRIYLLFGDRAKATERADSVLARKPDDAEALVLRGA